MRWWEGAVTFRGTWLNKSDEFTGISIRGRTASLPLQAALLKGQALHETDAGVFTRGVRWVRARTHTAEAQRRHIERDTTRRVFFFFPLGFLRPQLSLSWRQSAHRLFFVSQPDSSHVSDSSQPRRLSRSGSPWKIRFPRRLGAREPIAFYCRRLKKKMLPARLERLIEGEPHVQVRLLDVYHHHLQ